MERGIKRTQMLCLRLQEHLPLVAGSDAIPRADLIGLEDGCVFLDQAMIRQSVDSATTVDPRHTPSTAKREAQAMYGAWQKAYRALRKGQPETNQMFGLRNRSPRLPLHKVATPAPSRSTC